MVGFLFLVSAAPHVRETTVYRPACTPIRLNSYLFYCFETFFHPTHAGNIRLSISLYLRVSRSYIQLSVEPWNAVVNFFVWEFFSESVNHVTTKFLVRTCLKYQWLVSVKFIFGSHSIGSYNEKSSVNMNFQN